MRAETENRTLLLIIYGAMLTVMGVAIYIMGNSPSDTVNDLIQSFGVLVSGVGISMLFFVIMRAKKTKSFN